MRYRDGFRFCSLLSNIRFSVGILNLGKCWRDLARLAESFLLKPISYRDNKIKEISIKIKRVNEKLLRKLTRKLNKEIEVNKS